MTDHIIKNNLKSRAFSYVHDALYFDIYPTELFEMIKVISHYMNEIPMEKYNLPVKADIPLGYSMGQDLTVESMTERPDGNGGTFVLSGWEDEFDLLINSWKTVYKSVEWVDVDPPKEVYVSNTELFVPKRAYSPHYGTTRRKVTREVVLVMT